MQDADRKVLWALVVALVVIAFEIALQRWESSEAVWTTALNALLVGSTIMLWVATRQSARVAERALTQLERPYVFFQDTTHENDTYTILFVNHGKTPAIIKSRRLACEYLERSPVIEDIPEHHFPKGAVIGAGKEWPRGKVEVTSEMRDAMARGAGRIYLYGELKYLDVLGNEHRTWFCRRFNRRLFILDDLTDSALNGYD